MEYGNAIVGWKKVYFRANGNTTVFVSIVALSIAWLCADYSALRNAEFLLGDLRISLEAPRIDINCTS